MDARGFLERIGSAVSDDFVKSRTLLSFEEYLQLFFEAPQQQARNAAQYLKDTLDAFGTVEVPHPSGPMRRFKLFDGAPGEGGHVAGQEEVQNAFYRLLGNFVRAGRINKLILLHGPNGSAKSSFVAALKRGLEAYSRRPEGALYSFNWVFPTRKLEKGSIGFSGNSGGASLGSFAHLEAEHIDLRLTSALREHPLLLVPRADRRALIEQALERKGVRDFVIPASLLEGELSARNRRIFDALLSSYGGDWLEVLRHVQVERFYVSRRYQVGAFTVEPAMSVDAGLQQLSVDRSHANLPPALHNVALFEPLGPVVAANRGLIEYSDLLKRPLETFKYLLAFSESAEVSLDTTVLQLDEVLIASSNEKHLAAFKELPDFASFKGRIELVRVPYLRRWRVEQEIYDAQVNAATVGRHVAPHATRVAALWAVLTRLKKPVADRFPAELRALVERLSPLEKLRLYQDGEAPARLPLSSQKELRKALPALYEESDAYPNYEGRTGASAREIKTALFNAAQSPEHDSLHPLAVLKELEAITRDKSVYEFLQQEIVDGYHDHRDFVRVVEEDYLDLVDREVRESMGLVSDSQYLELFERYVQTVSAFVKGEKVHNRLTGAMEPPDEGRMREFETFVMQKGEDAVAFRRAIISSVGAWRIDNPTAPVDYHLIFPDLFARLSDHFFEERKKQLRRNVENILKSFTDEAATLAPRERQAVRETLDALASRYGYTEASARDAIVFLMKKRHA